MFLILWCKIFLKNVEIFSIIFFSLLKKVMNIELYIFILHGEMGPWDGRPLPSCSVNKLVTSRGKEHIQIMIDENFFS
jgi:hypothetical protein